MSGRDNQAEAGAYTGKSVERFGETHREVKKICRRQRVFALLLMSAGTQNGIAQQPTLSATEPDGPKCNATGAAAKAVQNDTTGSQVCHRPLRQS